MADLRRRLDDLYADYNREDAAADPIQIVRRYADPADQEVVGFCAAALAFGRVASVLNTVETLTAIMGPRPAEYVRSFDPGAPHPELRRMVHRWFFCDGDDDRAPDLSDALDSFSRRALALDLRAAYGRVPKRAGVCYFFPRPSAGSGCKRLNLFLRWMVRRDAVDLGAWTRVRRSRLVVPLDTHVIRLGQCLRLTRYASPGWRMAADITASLRRIDPADPVKYDFSLCHVGMMNACGFGRRQGDSQCPLKGLCHPRRRAGAARRALPPASPRS